MTEERQDLKHLLEIVFYNISQRRRDQTAEQLPKQLKEVRKRGVKLSNSRVYITYLNQQINDVVCLCKSRATLKKVLFVDREK